VGTSRWSAPILIQPAASAGESRAPAYEPILLRAWSRPEHCLHEAVVRLEPGGVQYSRTMVLRVEPHVVVSNRTGYELRLLQPQAMHAAGQVLGAYGQGGCATWCIQSGVDLLWLCHAHWSESTAYLTEMMA
jgi:hypothetical protein